MRTSSPEQASEYITKAAPTVPVVIETTRSVPSPTSSVSGGIGMWWDTVRHSCTSGFSLLNGAGATAILTAGHCTGVFTTPPSMPGDPDWVALGPPQNLVFAGSQDRQIHVVPSPHFALGRFATLWGWYPPTGRQNPVQDQFLCKTGQTTSTTCWNVAEINHSIPPESASVPGCDEQLVRGNQPRRTNLRVVRWWRQRRTHLERQRSSGRYRPRRLRKYGTSVCLPRRENPRPGPEWMGDRHMNASRTARLGCLALALVLGLAPNHKHASAATVLSGTKWRVHSYSVGGGVVDLPFHNSIAGAQFKEREFSFGRQTYLSTLTCVPNRGRFSVRGRPLPEFDRAVQARHRVQRPVPRRLRLQAPPLPLLRRQARS